jgi:ankyrin repeat protein
LAKGAKVDVHDSLGTTPSANCCPLRNPESGANASHCLKDKADVDAVDTDGWTALHTAPFNDIVTEQEPIAQCYLNTMQNF